ncbi:MAG: SEC-C metal-binding domain-containing protein [Elusimicrobiales bacterium]|jgi:hypothetical protein
MWDFLKKLRKTEAKEPAAANNEVPVQKPEPARQASAAPAQPVQAAATAAGGVPPKAEKPHAEKTDEELAEELNGISPEILSQAKNPEMRKLVINIYRKMLVDGVNVNNDKEVKKWLKKHPEAAAGGDVQKVETVKRAEPKVGRNDPCNCGSGKKYKKCCGAKGY